MRTFTTACLLAIASATRIDALEEDLLTDATVPNLTTGEDLEAGTEDSSMAENPDLDQPVDDSTADGSATSGYTGKTTGWENWVGKYRFQGASDWWLEAMYEADSNKDGSVTLSEAVEAAESIGATVSEDVAAQAAAEPNKTDWDMDLDLLTELLPLGFDHDGDRRLSYDETMAFFAAIGKTDGDEIFDEFATLEYDDLEYQMEEVRYGGDFDQGQFEGKSMLFQSLQFMDSNGDAIVSLEEMVAGMQGAVGLGLTVDSEEVLAEYGRDYDWIHDDELISRILSADHDITSYHGLYDLLEVLSFPHVTDEYFYSDEDNDVGATWEAFVEWVHDMKTNDNAWWMTPSTEWVAREARFDDTFKEWWTGIYWFSYFRPTFEELLDGGISQGVCTEDEIVDYRSYDEAYHWWSHPTTLADVVINGINDQFETPGTAYHLDYEHAYALFAYLGYPWILDTDFDLVFPITESGAGTSAITSLMRTWMFESDEWQRSPPPGWIPMEDRLVPDVAFDPTELEIRAYLHEQIQESIDMLEALDAQVLDQELEELDWTEHEHEQRLEDLSDLLFVVQDVDFTEEDLNLV